MIILFQNILFLKQFLACNGCFGLYTKIKKGSWTGFGCIISAGFFHEIVPYVILYQLIKFQCHIFFHSRDIKQNVLLSSGFILNHPLSQWMAGKNWRKVGNKIFWISREQKGLFRWNKKHFLKLFKGTLSVLKQFLGTQNPLKMMKNAFYFTSKAFFVLKLFKFLSWFFCHVAKQLDKKDKVNLKFYEVTSWLRNSCNTHIA